MVFGEVVVVVVVVVVVWNSYCLERWLWVEYVVWSMLSGAIVSLSTGSSRITGSLQPLVHWRV